MKTLFLFEDDSGAHFFELEGDQSGLNDVYLGADMPEGLPHTDEQYGALQDALCLIVYGEPDEAGEVDGEFVFDEIEIPTKDWDFFVRCGDVSNV
jgi:hypothetical protein